MKGLVSAAQACRPLHSPMGKLGPGRAGCRADVLGVLGVLAGRAEHGNLGVAIGAMSGCHSSAPTNELGMQPGIEVSR